MKKLLTLATAYLLVASACNAQSIEAGMLLGRDFRLMVPQASVIYKDRTTSPTFSPYGCFQLRNSWFFQLSYQYSGKDNYTIAEGNSYRNTLTTNNHELCADVLYRIYRAGRLDVKVQAGLSWYNKLGEYRREGSTYGGYSIETSSVVYKAYYANTGIVAGYKLTTHVIAKARAQYSHYLFGYGNVGFPINPFDTERSRLNVALGFAYLFL
ncbi:MAG: hypothetical protein H0X33_03465 [Taibaiella sp.]|nr:hypothetical protein [Taibaiella sp.]